MTSVTPDQCPNGRIVCSSFLVCPSPERHDVVPPLLDQTPNDALNSITDEVSTHLICLLLVGDQLAAVKTAQMAHSRTGHDGECAKPGEVECGVWMSQMKLRATSPPSALPVCPSLLDKVPRGPILCRPTHLDRERTLVCRSLREKFMLCMATW